MAELAGKWGELRIKYELQWEAYKKGGVSVDLERDYKRYKSIQAALEAKEVRLPDDRKLLRECCEDVLKSRGLKRRV